MLQLPTTSIGNFRLHNASLPDLEAATETILSEYLSVALPSRNKWKGLGGRSVQWHKKFGI
jgi:hypothetical protein